MRRRRTDRPGRWGWVVAAVLWCAACASQTDSKDGKSGAAGSSGPATEEEMDTVKKNDAQWKEILTPEQYLIARKKGTERAFSGKYWDNKEAGVYRCVCCDLPLYSSEAKYESGSGWPSFWEAIDDEAVATEVDRSLFSVRTELLCRRCDAHLGHVFDDGPEPTGKRHCINSASLTFRPGETSGETSSESGETSSETSSETSDQAGK